MITLWHVHYEIYDEVRKNKKVQNSFLKKLYKFSYQIASNIKISKLYY